ncbi:MAG: flagellar basal-body rod protein FlgF [Desulfobacterales bacterium]|nr:flagellar basal-body rod protein FlgF [Desulfobacterales bacterium]MDD3949879.1 flagellar basal-body rod protein FlgF [Desulfobacterales bacterium]MDY0378820.1 flagellar basal-body rod protein FlgF [Desulfobacterales bacterium]
MNLTDLRAPCYHTHGTSIAITQGKTFAQESFMPYQVGDVANACSRTMSQLDYVTHNLANVNTPGFKAEYLHFARMTQNDGLAPESGQMAVNFESGTLQETGNPLDAALEGDGFFVVEAGPGGSAYTRQGNFTLDRDGYLVTAAGDKVLGASGPIQVEGDRISIDDQGRVISDGDEAGRLRVVRFEYPQELRRKGSGLFTDPGNAGGTPEDDPRLKSGSLENSNVNVVWEMVAMIDIQRTFEAYQKVIQTMADQDRLSTSRVGKLY